MSLPIATGTPTTSDPNSMHQGKLRESEGVKKRYARELEKYTKHMKTLMTDTECLTFINDNPGLLSFLYDADLLPEQCQRDSFNRHRMRMIANLWHQRVKPYMTA